MTKSKKSILGLKYNLLHLKTSKLLTFADFIKISFLLIFFPITTLSYGQIDKTTTKTNTSINTKVIPLEKVNIKSIHFNEELINHLATMEKITNQSRRLIVEESKQYAIGQYI